MKSPALFSLSFGEQDDMTTEFTPCASIVADLCDPDAVTALNGSTQNGSGRGRRWSREMKMTH